MKVPEAVLERAARAAYRRSFERAPEIRRPYRDADWRETADEPTRQHFRDLVAGPLEAALEQLRGELLGEAAVNAALDAHEARADDYANFAMEDAIRANWSSVLGEAEQQGGEQ